MLLNTVAGSLVSGYAVARNNSDFPEGPLLCNDVTRPERNSDHDMPVAYFSFPLTAIESLDTVAADLQAVLDGGAKSALRARIADALKKVEGPPRSNCATPAEDDNRRRFASGRRCRTSRA